jgi:hypothetical protein
MMFFQIFQVFVNALSLTCSQRPGGLAQWRLPLSFMRATNVHFRTTFSAGLLPPLRQTARYLLPIFVGLFVSLATFVKSNAIDCISIFRGYVTLTEGLSVDFFTASPRSVTLLTFRRYKIA